VGGRPRHKHRASTAAGTLTRVDPGRETVTATVRVGERPYAVAASPQAIWVAVLGRPVMMHVPARISQQHHQLAAPPVQLELCS
jgi:hypothetical protein